MPSVSVIVPVRNEAGAIEPALRTLLDQDFPRDQFEVLVADGGSTDETVPIVRRLQGEQEGVVLLGCTGAWAKVTVGDDTGWLSPAGQCANPLTTCP